MSEWNAYLLQYLAYIPNGKRGIKKTTSRIIELIRLSSVFNARALFFFFFFFLYENCLYRKLLMWAASGSCRYHIECDIFPRSARSKAAFDDDFPFASSSLTVFGFYRIALTCFVCYRTTKFLFVVNSGTLCFVLCICARSIFRKIVCNFLGSLSGTKIVHQKLLIVILFDLKTCLKFFGEFPLKSESFR